MDLLDSLELPVPNGVVIGAAAVILLCGCWGVRRCFLRSYHGTNGKRRTRGSALQEAKDTPDQVHSEQENPHSEWRVETSLQRQESPEVPAACYFREGERLMYHCSDNEWVACEVVALRAMDKAILVDVVEDFWFPVDKQLSLFRRNRYGVGEEVEYYAATLNRWVKARVVAVRDDDGALRLGASQGGEDYDDLAVVAPWWLRVAEQDATLRYPQEDCFDLEQVVSDNSAFEFYKIGDLLQQRCDHGSWRDCTVIDVREDMAVEVDTERGRWFSLDEQEDEFRRNRYDESDIVEYNSATQGTYIRAKVNNVRPQDGAIQLSVKRGYWFSVADQISKMRHVGKAYKLDEPLYYNSITNGKWIAVRVVDVNPEDGAVQISLKSDCWFSLDKQSQHLRRNRYELGQEVKHRLTSQGHWTQAWVTAVRASDGAVTVDVREGSWISLQEQDICLRGGGVDQVAHFTSEGSVGPPLQQPGETMPPQALRASSIAISVESDSEGEADEGHVLRMCNHPYLRSKAGSRQTSPRSQVSAQANEAEVPACGSYPFLRLTDSSEGSFAARRASGELQEPSTQADEAQAAGASGSPPPRLSEATAVRRASGEPQEPSAQADEAEVPGVGSYPVSQLSGSSAGSTEVTCPTRAASSTENPFFTPAPPPPLSLQPRGSTALPAAGAASSEEEAGQDCSASSVDATDDGADGSGDNRQASSSGAQAHEDQPHDRLLRHRKTPNFGEVTNLLAALPTAAASSLHNDEACSVCSTLFEQPHKDQEPPAKDQADRLLEQAQTLHELGRLEEAEGLYREVLESKPASVSTLCGLGRLLRDQDDLDGAEEALRVALDLAPFDAPTLAALAAVLAERGDVEAAETMRKKAELAECTPAKRRSMTLKDHMDLVDSEVDTQIPLGEISSDTPGSWGVEEASAAVEEGRFGAAASSTQPKAHRGDERVVEVGEEEKRRCVTFSFLESSTSSFILHEACHNSESGDADAAGVGGASSSADSSSDSSSSSSSKSSKRRRRRRPCSGPTRTPPARWAGQRRAAQAPGLKAARGLLMLL